MQRPYAANERLREKKTLIFFGLIIFIVIAWLQRLNWANWASYGNVMPQYVQQRTHSKCRSKRRDIRLKIPKSLNFAFGLLGGMLHIFQFRSFSIRCHANLLKKKNTAQNAQCQWHSIQFTNTLFRACISQKQLDFVFLFEESRWARAYN